MSNHDIVFDEVRTDSHLYALVDPRDESQTFRYIGICVNVKSRYKLHLHCAKNNSTAPVSQWVKRLGEEGVKPRMIVFATINSNIWSLVPGYLVARCAEAGLIGMAQKGRWLGNYCSYDLLNVEHVEGARRRAKPDHFPELQESSK